jgi:hypothetical protein
LDPTLAISAKVLFFIAKQAVFCWVSGTDNGHSLKPNPNQGNVMKNKNMLVKLLPAAVALLLSGQTLASITLYDNEGTTFSADGLINVFYT